MLVVYPTPIKKEDLQNYLVEFRWNTRSVDKTMQDDIKKVYQQVENSVESAISDVSKKRLYFQNMINEDIFLIILAL